ncbi:MAG TPA: nucleoside deaminase [Cytophagaceae bacterium]|jgi:tRNA(adenine34) deaminase
MILSIHTPEHFMREALKEAQKAFDNGEVPIGAVVVSNNKIIARAHNQTEQLNDVTAHAEMIAITSAANYLGGKYLHDCDLYVTIEPCIMCAGALQWGQLRKVVFGASDPKQGFKRIQTNLLHPKTVLEYGVLKEDCEALIKLFFQNLRE